jgi:hypothetical protein
VGAKRTIEDLVIDRGVHLRVEWYWRADGTMPGRDEYEALTQQEREDLLAAVGHWVKRKPGEHAHKSVVNREHEKPLILAIKVGKRRFPTFEGIPGSSWIVLESYEKEGNKRDKVGDRAIERAVKARDDYYQRVKRDTYYPSESREGTSPAETGSEDRKVAERRTNIGGGGAKGSRSRRAH